MALTQISTKGIKDSNVTSVDIADQAVTLDKLPHGTSSNDGKFLRANNGADPSFESLPASTTINNNADNRVITGSGTANTLNGESSVIIDSSGQLGVGNTSPLHKLEVLNGSDHENIIVARGADTTTEYAGIGVHGGNAVFTGGGVGSTDAGIVFRTAASGSEAEAMRITSEGRVGIGKTPSSFFDIETGTNNNGFNLNCIGTPANYFMNVRDDNVSKFYINNDGKVGIGTDTPAFKLHLNESTSGSNYISFTNSDTGTSGSDGAQVGIDGSERLIVWQAENNAIRFATNNSERMRIDASGQVGILESTPRGQLQVNSNKNIKSDLHSNTNSHLHLRNPNDDTGEGCGISFSVTSNETKVGASIFHERTGGGSEGSLNFATNTDGNTTREQMQLSSGGILTRPYTPSFAAHSISLGTSKSFGQGHGSTLWDTNYLEPMPVWGHNQNGASVHTIYNNGNDMSFHNFTTSGGQAAGYIKFTAPVTGSYVFWIAGCTITTDNGDWIGFGLNKNFTGNNNNGDLDYYISQMHNDGSDARRCMNGQVTVPLSANDYVVLYARSPNVTSILDRIVFGGYQLY